MEPLYGSFEHSLDGKGRFVIPAPLRLRFERNKDAAVVSCYLESCLAVWPPEEFSRLLAIASAVQDIGPEERQMARALTGHSVRVDIDTQWRITVPAFWREYAGLQLEQSLMVVGVLERVELWNVEQWRQRMSPTMDALAKGARRLFPNLPPGLQPVGGLQPVPGLQPGPAASVPSVAPSATSPAPGATSAATEPGGGTS